MSDQKIPSDVANIDAYMQFCRISADPLLSVAQRYYNASDGVSYDLHMQPGQLKSQIYHLGTDEQNEILEENNKRISLLKRRLYFKKKAYNLFFTSTKESGQRKVAYTYEGVLSTKKIQIIEMFGKMYSLDEVHRMCSVNWGLSVSKDELDLFRKQYSDIIREKQEEFKADFSGVRLTHKRSRLEELLYHYNDRLSTYKRTKTLNDQQMCLKIIEQIRKECEGDTLRIEGLIGLDVRHAIHTQLFSDTLQKMPLIDIIIGKVCASQNIDPKYIVAKLGQSIYAKFNRYVGQETYDEDEFLFPSQQIYDFDKIEKKQSQINELPSKLKNTDAAVVNKASAIFSRLKEIIDKEKHNSGLSTETL